MIFKNDYIFFFKIEIYSKKLLVYVSIIIISFSIYTMILKTFEWLSFKMQNNCLNISLNKRENISKYAYY